MIKMLADDSFPDMSTISAAINDLSSIQKNELLEFLIEQTIDLQIRVRQCQINKHEETTAYKIDRILDSDLSSVFSILGIDRPKERSEIDSKASNGAYKALYWKLDGTVERIVLNLPS